MEMMGLLNGDDGISDMEGKATRVGANEPGKRTSFISGIAMRRQTAAAEEITSEGHKL
jgi:hypothetical protein